MKEYMIVFGIALLQIPIDGIDVSKITLTGALMFAVYYLWQSYKQSIDRAIERETNVYNNILNSLNEIKEQLAQLNDMVKKDK